MSPDIPGELPFGDLPSTGRGKKDPPEKAVPPITPVPPSPAPEEDQPAIPESLTAATQARVAKIGENEDVGVYLGGGPLRDLMDQNFLDYAAYVIRDRAIPDIDDGLKPVQRRILWSLHEKDDGKLIKVANIAGYCMQFHPHGNVSIEDALVTLTNKNGYLIEGQGNFGNVHTGDPAAASRYIECRLTELARTQLFNDPLTRFIPSYDGRNKEPVVLPAKIPLLLMLGAEGIAVGLATRILPHNFCELIQAQINILRKKPVEVFPDFQSGGLMDVAQYDKGNGKVKVRAVIEKRSDSLLAITELPFSTTTESIMSSIEDAARKKKIRIRSLNDFTAEKVEIQIQLQQATDADETIQALYAFTTCEQSVSSNLLVIRDNRPVQMNVEEVLRHNTTRLVALLKAELEWDHNRLLDEFHNKTLVQIFIENRIYKRIEKCETYESVQKAVLSGVNEFRHLLKRDVTLEDVEMLLQVRIKRISLFDMKQNRKDLDDILIALDEVAKNLKSLTAYAVKYLEDLLKKYKKQYPRRTKITTIEEIEVRKLAATEVKVGVDAATGYLGTGVKSEETFTCSSLDKIVALSRDGRYFVMPPPEKQFIGEGIEHAGVYDRDKVMLCVYSNGPITYVKRFAFGGAIMNKEYRLCPEGSKVLLFAPGDAEKLFVKFKPAKHQRVHQMTLDVATLEIRSATSKGNQLSVKKIASVNIAKPRNWSDSDILPEGEEPEE